MAFQAGGGHLAISLSSQLQLWDLKNKRSLRINGLPKEVAECVFSGDGRLLALLRGKRKKIELWDVQNRNKLSDAPYDGTFSLENMSFVKNDRWLTAYDRFKNWYWDLDNGMERYTGDKVSLGDNMIAERFGERFTIRSLGKGRSFELTYHCLADQGYICLNKDNYFMASKQATRGLRFNLDEKIYPFEQFELQYNRPDKILETLGKASAGTIRNYYQAFLKRKSLTNPYGVSANRLVALPELDLTVVGDRYLTYDRAVRLRVQAEDENYPLAELHVTINGVPIIDLQGADLRAQASRKVKVELEVALSQGENDIKVWVTNSKGMASYKASAEMTYRPANNLYVVVMGVSQYQDAEYKLDFARKDAEDLSRLYRDVGQYRFNKVKILELYDKQVTLDSWEKIEQFLADSKIDDRLVMFLSGHGIIDEERNWYYAPYDMDFADPARRGIPFDRLEELLLATPARQRLVLIDACHSGELDEDMQLVTDIELPEGVKGRPIKAKGEGQYLGGGNSLDLMKTLFTDFRNRSGATVIASASGAQFSYETKDYENGIFTYALLDGLRSNRADFNGNGTIMVGELKQYLEETVKRLSNQLQQPTTRTENTSYDFRIW